MATRKVTIRDVAAEANVSIASVSLYLNGKPGLSDTTRQRIEEAVRRLDYNPRRANPQTPESSFIGLLVEKLPFSTFSDMFYGEVVQGMEARARELGYHIVLMVLESKTELPRLIAERNRNIVGLVALGGGEITEEIITNLLEEELPIILVDNNIPGIAMDCVLADNFGGAELATQHLLQCGHQRIAFVQGPDIYPSLTERFQGYCAALIKAGMPLNPDLIQPAVSRGLPNKGYREMKALLERRQPFDAVFCVSDRTALGALQALQEAGLRVPDDVAVVGFDNVAQARHTVPPLTTIEVPKRAMGDIAIRRLHDLITGRYSEIPVKNVLYTSLVIRNST
ncbi:MAG: LacI family DNA-binding transcriptional regulator [Anaerolineae bacterium]|nr:LacI family DNA-binding transcriptional regulator [Anaerolineae bacterium]